MIPVYASRIVKIVHFANRHEVDCADGGFTTDLTRARMYDDDEPDDQILAYYYDKDVEVLRVRLTVETSIKKDFK